LTHRAPVGAWERTLRKSGPLAARDIKTVRERGRNIEKVTEAVGLSDNLLVVELDVDEPRGCASRGQKLR